MRQISFSADVYAPFETLWELLLDRIEHPKEYLPGAEDVRIIERHEDVLHPLFSGIITHRIVPLSRQSPVSPVHLTMIVDWVPKNEESERIIVETMPSEIQQEVLSIKEEAEARSK